MIVEQELCKRLAAIFKGLLPEVDVEGNWIVEELKGLGLYHAARLSIDVSPRRYEGYTARIAELTVRLEGEFRFESDTDLARALAAYEAVSEHLALWHADIAAVRRELTVADCFEPVGLRLGDGEWTIDRDSKTRIYSHQLTLKGRIIA